MITKQMIRIATKTFEAYPGPCTTEEAMEAALTAALSSQWRGIESELKTRDGREARILATDQPLIAGRSIVAIYRVNDTEWTLNAFYANGRFYPDQKGEPRLDLGDLILPLPPPPEEKAE